MNINELKCNEEEKNEERKYIQEIIQSFQTYFLYTQQWLQHQIEMILSLDEDERQLLRKQEQKWKMIIKACISNQYVFNEIIKNQRELIEQNQLLLMDEEQQKEYIRSLNEEERYHYIKQMDKVKSMLTHLYRDWSEEGKEERITCYTPLLQELERLYPQIERRNTIKVLIPGAGLGRLAYEIALRGFQSEGNEFSYFMLFTSFFILNGIEDQ